MNRKGGFCPARRRRHWGSAGIFTAIFTSFKATMKKGKNKEGKKKNKTPSLSFAPFVVASFS
jgi:hypothetical protein